MLSWEDAHADTGFARTTQNAALILETEHRDAHSKHPDLLPCKQVSGSILPGALCILLIGVVLGSAFTATPGTAWSPFLIVRTCKIDGRSWL